MADTEHDIAIQVAEDQRERECATEVINMTTQANNDRREGVMTEDKRAREGQCCTPDFDGYCVKCGCNVFVTGGESCGYYTSAIPLTTNTAGVTTNPLRTEADWQHAERVIALLADELADATECDRIGGEPTIIRPCPATDYCIDHYPDSLPCEDATCPAVIAAWAREKEDV